jgi:hypothetical protein
MEGGGQSRQHGVDGVAFRVTSQVCPVRYVTGVTSTVRHRCDQYGMSQCDQYGMSQV